MIRKTYIDHLIDIDDNGNIKIWKEHYPAYQGRALVLAQSVGYLFQYEVLALQTFARSLPEDAIIVNVGAGAGTSGLAFAEARPDLIPRIYTVDNANNRGPLGGLVPEQNAFRENGIPFVNQILGDSSQVGRDWKLGDVDLVFIDADHSPEGVERDTLAWLPHVKHGGYVLYHDSKSEQWTGVYPTAERLMAGKGTFIFQIDTLRIYRVL